MGKVMMSGVAPQMKVPITEILASDLAVGSSVYLMEKGVATEYLVVNKGKPSGSSLYDDSCDGLWLLRKDCCSSERQFYTSNVNDYENSTIHAWLNGDFFNMFGSVEQNVVKQVKIPYRSGSGYDKTVTSGVSGLSAKIFLLSADETAFSHDYKPTNEGATLSYFTGCAANKPDQKRIAFMNDAANHWWLRSPYCFSSWGAKGSMIVTNEGNWVGANCQNYYGIRPALVLPSNALFDKNTLICKGVS